ncbi:MAG: endonuclease/exonuclease/phosphatase family protein [Bacteroidia bacterium]
MYLKIWLVIALFILISWLGKLIYSQKRRKGKLVVSYNIRFDTSKDGPNAWPHRKKRLANQLLSHQPALIGMQEVLHHQLTDLLELFPAYYQYIGVGRDDGRQRGEYAPIWYDNRHFRLLQQGNFWLSENPERPSKGWDAACYRICTWAAFETLNEKRNLWVFNTHLDHQGAEARQQSAQLLHQMASRIPAGDPVLLMGDFNSQPQDAPYQYLSEAGWLDSRATAEKREGPIGTFPGFGGERLEKRIDYLFYKNLPPPHGYLVDGPPDREQPFASDHLPVMVCVAL